MGRGKTTRGDVASPIRAVVARQFTATRLERQVIAQVFELVWRAADRDAGTPVSVRDADCHLVSTASMPIVASCGSAQGGAR